jgi:CRP-like cAMP-binding protein
MEARRMVHDEQRKLMRQPVRALTPNADDLLVRVPFFANLKKEDFSRVVEKLVSRTVLAEETIIRQGERGQSLFMIARGVVAVFVDSGDAGVKRIASLHAGDFFGEMALLSDKPRNATVRAVTDCHLYELQKKDVDALCEVCEGAKEALVNAAASRRHRDAVQPQTSA